MKEIEALSYFIPQINFFVGDIDRNKDNIISAIKSGEKRNTDLIIFPELALTGYPPRDLLQFSSFHTEIGKALDEIISSINSSHVILGVPLYDHKNRLRNSAIIINETGIVYTYYKTLLPDYDVFDESRYFYPNDNPGIV